MEVLNRLREKFEITGDKVQRDDLALVETTGKDLIPVLVYLKTYEGFKTLVMISCVDWMEKGKFQLSYNLWNPEKKKNIIVKIFLDRENPVFQTIYKIWPQAEVYEREIHEMFGVNFEGNPTQDEELILEDWEEIPPMRRDFNTLRYSMEKFGEREPKSGIIIRKQISEQYDEWRRK